MSLRRNAFLLVVATVFSTKVLSQNDARQVYQKAAPAIVLIKTDKGTGTGFVVSPSGMIVTALHVVDGAAGVAVKMQSGDIYDDVSMVAQDERRDVAVLKVNGFDLPAVSLGNSNTVNPGDRIFVIGNPLGAEELKTTISDGIVSGIRDLNDGYKTLQITAPVSPGNSGGPALNTNAEAVGIVVFRLSPGENLNFAVPVNYVHGLLDSVDVSKILKRWSKSDASPNLFLDTRTGRPTRWKSVETGAVYTLRFQGEYIYAEREQPDEFRKLGLFYTAEVRRSGDKYVGTAHTNHIWWNTNPYTGEKVVTDKCSLDFPMELSSVSSTRIEGRTYGPPEGKKLQVVS
jgi:V8-like Glu-specific endopeptidase